MPNRVTLKDVAARCGVSAMTVSRVLRGQKYVSEELRAKVENAARELGYQADPMLSALSEHRRRVGIRKSYNKIGIINAWPQNRDWLTQTGPGKTLYTGIQSRSAELGFETEVFHLELVDGKITRLLEMLHARSITGLLLLPLPIPVPPAFTQRAAEWKNFVIVSVEHGFGYPNCNYVWTDQFASACTLWDELWKRGYRRIGLELSTEYAKRSHGLWEAAYRLMRNQSHVPEEDKLPIFRTELTTREEFLRWFTEHRPDAMIGKTREMWQWVREHEPERADARPFGFATFDWDVEPGTAAGIRQRREEIGATAINLLFQLLQERQYGEPPFDRGVLIPGHWHNGPTV